VAPGESVSRTELCTLAINGLRACVFTALVPFVVGVILGSWPAPVPRGRMVASGMAALRRGNRLALGAWSVSALRRHTAPSLRGISVSDRTEPSNWYAAADRYRAILCMCRCRRDLARGCATFGACWNTDARCCALPPGDRFSGRAAPRKARGPVMRIIFARLRAGWACQEPNPK